MLTDYGVAVRYPFPLELNESDVRIALRSAQKIKDYILTKTTSEEVEGDDDEIESSSSEAPQA